MYSPGSALFYSDLRAQYCSAAAPSATIGTGYV
jgi:hypothetical protein